MVVVEHPPVVPPVLVALREATRDSHKSVERLTPFFRPDFDQPAYLRWLDLMYGFYRHIDAAVDHSAFCAATGWQYEPRCGLIERDISLLANRSPHAPSDPGSVLAGLRGLTQVSEIAGLLYVVEGSALGGEILLKVLGRSAGVSAASGASFFAPHGSHPQLRWADYVQLLGHLGSTPEFEQDAVRGAVTTFTVLQSWIGSLWAQGR